MIPSVTARVLTLEECEKFDAEPCPINWGIVCNGEPVACFQAEPEADGWLSVHANVKRRALHPAISAAYAKTFSEDLMRHGAVGLVAEIAINNRAAIRLAKAAGYKEVHRNESWMTLVYGSN